MAVRINPCFGCPLRVGCDLRADYAKRVRGLDLRSATFNCEKLYVSLAAGTRIEIAAPVRDYRVTPTSDDHGFEFEITRFNVPATITGGKLYQFTCVVDREPLKAAMEKCGDFETDVDRVRFRKTMKHSRIVRFLDEPKRPRCDFGNPITPEGKCDVRDGVCDCKQFAEKAA